MSHVLARIMVGVGGALAGAWVLGCAHGSGDSPRALRPDGPGDRGGGGVSAFVRTQPIADLRREGAVARGTTVGDRIDTRTFAVQIQDPGDVVESRLVKNILPAHTKPAEFVEGEKNELRAGATLDEARTRVEAMFPAITSTGWNPPDPTLAVGPGHVVVTVNQDIAWFTRAGVQQFRTNLGSPGSPGFFEAEGAQNFCFDPKVVYDHHAGRFVVLVLETYGTTQAFIDIAVSDDSDPNGVWYRYRTDAVLDIGTNTVWWDFPGLGYDQNAYYVTGNLFSLTSGGSYGGAGIRIFDKAPLLSGQPATHSTLRISGGYTVQPAIHFGANQAGYLVDVTSSTNVRVYAITNPLTAPALVQSNVAVPAYAGAVGAPTLSGGALSNADITMPTWRDGRLVMIQNASVNGRNMARWHDLRTNAWPASGSATRSMSGDVDAGLQYHTVFPAISINSLNQVGVVMGRTSEDERVGVAIAGRRAADPAGRMGEPVLVKAGESSGGGRWGDYQQVVVDPVDDETFWAIAEYRGPSGWRTWVTSFRVADQSLCHPVADWLGPVQSAAPIGVDVLGNDWHSQGTAMVIDSFDATSARGGTIAREVGAGPGGRDRLVYTPPATLPAGLDSFAYTVRDVFGNTASGAVSADLYNPASYRDAWAGPVRAGVHASYFALSAPTQLPDFTTLVPYAEGVVAQVNYASGTSNVAGSGRASDVGAVFAGYVDVPATDLYRFSTTSDDGSRLLLGGAEIVGNDGTHGMVERSSALIGLKAGRHPVRVEFFQGGGAGGLVVSYEGLATPKQVVPAARWSIDRCPADVDDGAGNGVPDGGVTIDDMIYFLGLVELGAIGADVDDGSGTGTPDGGVTIDDVIYFIVRFEGGC